MDELVFLTVGTVIDVVVRIENRRAGYRLVVDQDFPIANLDRIPANSNEPLDEGALRVVRVAKHDDVASSGRLKTVDELVDQNAVAFDEGWMHGPGRNLKRRHDERPNDQGESGGPEEGFKIFSPGRDGS